MSLVFAPPPDGLANFVDIFAVLAGFQGNQLASRIWLELVGSGGDQNEPDASLIDFADIFAAVGAFQGGSYPFSDPCECVRLGPCP